MRLLWMILPFLCLPVTAAAQAPPLTAPAPVAPEVLRVGVVERPPYTIRTEDGAWMGYAVDLWRATAEAAGWRYDFHEIGRGAAVEAVRGGEMDLVLPVEARPGLAGEVTFSQPFHTATMGVATHRQWRIATVAQGFLSLQALRLVAGLSVLLLIVGAGIWLLERRRNEQQFNRSPVRGLGDGFWWAGVTLTTIGYGDKAPVTLAGRVLAMLWMLVGLAVSAGLTAAVVSLAGVKQQVDLPETLSDRTVAVVEDSTAEAALRREGVDLIVRASLAAALSAASDGAADAVAAPAPELSWAIDESGGLDLTVRTTPFDPNYLAVALPQGSPLRPAIDAALLRHLQSELGWRLVERYLSDAG